MSDAGKVDVRFCWSCCSFTEQICTADNYAGQTWECQEHRDKPILPPPSLPAPVCPVCKTACKLPELVAPRRLSMREKDWMIQFVIWAFVLAVCCLGFGCYNVVDPNDVKRASLICWPTSNPGVVVAWSPPGQFFVTVPIDGGEVQIHKEDSDVPIDLTCKIVPFKAQALVIRREDPWPPRERH